MVFQGGEIVHFVCIANSVPYTCSTTYMAMFPDLVVVSKSHLAKYQTDLALLWGQSCWRTFCIQFDDRRDTNVRSQSFPTLHHPSETTKSALMDHLVSAATGVLLSCAEDALCHLVGRFFLAWKGELSKVKLCYKLDLKSPCLPWIGASIWL